MCLALTVSEIHSSVSKRGVAVEGIGGEEVPARPNGSKAPTRVLGLPKSSAFRQTAVGARTFPRGNTCS